MVKNKEQKSRIFANNWFMLRYVFRITPGYAIWQMGNSVLEAAALFLVNTYIYRVVTNMIVEGADFGRVVRVFAVFSAVMLVHVGSNGLFQYMGKQRMKEKLGVALQQKMYRKAVGIPLSCYDDPEYYNKFMLAGSQAKQKAWEVMADVSGLVNSFLVALFNGILFLSLDRLGIFFVVGSIFLSFGFRGRLNHLMMKRETDGNPLKKEMNYIHRVFYQRNYAMELRLYPVAGILKKHFANSSKKLQKVFRETGRELAILDFTSSYLSGFFLFFILYMSILVYKASVLKSITPGDVVALFMAVDFLASRILHMISKVGKFHENALFIERFRSFLTQPEEQRTEAAGLDGGLELKNVSFCYKKNDKEVLHEINMSLKPGERIAIVGPNGSGKTTLVKLLAGLYQPDKGEITWRGIPVSQMEKRGITKAFCAVFQNAHVYAVTLMENISMCPEEQTEEAKAWEALQASGLTELSRGDLRREMTHEFFKEGIALSGGQEKKMALARYFYKNAPVSLLDEPVSSLDPEAEKNFNDRVLSGQRQGLTILTSHRLACVSLCDRIFYMEDGWIREEGSHEELIRRNGCYAAMYRTQAENFRMIEQER